MFVNGSPPTPGLPWGYSLMAAAAPQSLMELLLHAVDIAHPSFPWEEECRWARLVATEFQVCRPGRSAAAYVLSSSFVWAGTGLTGGSCRGAGVGIHALRRRGHAGQGPGLWLGWRAPPRSRD